jgi:hypothetical protein
MEVSTHEMAQRGQIYYNPYGDDKVRRMKLSKLIVKLKKRRAKEAYIEFSSLFDIVFRLSSNGDYKVCIRVLDNDQWFNYRINLPNVTAMSLFRALYLMRLGDYSMFVPKPEHKISHASFVNYALDIFEPVLTI